MNEAMTPITDVNELQTIIARLDRENFELKKVIDDQAVRLYQQNKDREDKLFRLYLECSSGLVYSEDLEAAALLDLKTAAVLLKVWEAEAPKMLAEARASKEASLQRDETKQEEPK